MEELCFRLLANNNVSIDEDLLMEEMINFAVNNNIFVSGNLDLGYCLCSDNQKIPLDLESTLIDFLKQKFCNLFRIVIFNEYDGKEDDFKEIKRISIND